MNCPNCGAAAPDGALECAGCQIVFEKWAKKQAAQPKPAVPAPGSSPAPPPAVGLSAASQSGDMLDKLQAETFNFPDGRMYYVGWWRRIAAVVLDGWILMIIFGVLGVLNNLIITWVGQWIYCTILESSGLMATLGKRILGVSVRDARGDRISFIAANKRYWSKPVWMFWVWIRCAFAFFTGNKAFGVNALLEKPFWHDRFAGTLVVRRT